MPRSSPTPSSSHTPGGPGSTSAWPRPEPGAGPVVPGVGPCPCQEWDLRRWWDARVALSDPARDREEHPMKLDSLQKLYIAELQDLYSAETQILKALPKMAKAASRPELQAAFQEHLEQTQGQVERLETIF